MTKVLPFFRKGKKITKWDDLVQNLVSDTFLYINIFTQCLFLFKKKKEDIAKKTTMGGLDKSH